MIFQAGSWLPKMMMTVSGQANKNRLGEAVGLSLLLPRRFTLTLECLRTNQGTLARVGNLRFFKAHHGIFPITKIGLALMPPLFYWSSPVRIIVIL